MDCLENSIPIHHYQSGELARIVHYERVNGRCPTCAFLNGIERQMLNKFKGPFDALMKTGAEYCNAVRFKALLGAGKPLWEFKEHDHRLFCYRSVVHNTKFVLVVLFNGWIKEKKGKTDKEVREIERAKSLYAEFLSEYPGGNI
jgi:hypothetical protein